MTAVQVEAPAKVNLHLAVGAVGTDGYHHVDTVLVALDLCDVVRIEPAASLRLTCDPDVGCSERDNIAWRAAEALASAVGRPPHVSVSVSKFIPHAAGLGGGSSDAAAVLAGCARLWDVPDDDPALEAVARSLGADVPFFLHGGCALYGGRGDRRIRELPLPCAWFTLAKPDGSVATAEAYAEFDRSPRERRPGPGAVTDALRRCEARALGEALFNNMAASSLRLVPEAGHALALLERQPGCLGATLAGSGSAVFGVFAEEREAREAASAARAAGLWSVAARPRGHGTLDATDVGGVAS